MLCSKFRREGQDDRIGKVGALGILKFFNNFNIINSRLENFKIL